MRGAHRASAEWPAVQRLARGSGGGAARLQPCATATHACRHGRALATRRYRRHGGAWCAGVQHRAQCEPAARAGSRHQHRGDGRERCHADRVAELACRPVQLAPRVKDAAVVLRTALGKSPLVRALKDGAVASDRIAFDFVDVDPITRAFRRMTRAMEFDLCEIALTTHAQARAYGKPITALPVVLLRGLHHGALICRADSPLRGPTDLVGKRIGVRAWSQTTGVWVRGVLHDEYGVTPDSMTWITEEDAHVQEFTDPPFVQRMAPGQDLRAMLLSGEIDAAIALAGMDP